MLKICHRAFRPLPLYLCLSTSNITIERGIFYQTASKMIFCKLDILPPRTNWLFDYQMVVRSH
jgi:hypothetical protein